jgi:hypothetical protein
MCSDRADIRFPFLGGEIGGSQAIKLIRGSHESDVRTRVLLHDTNGHLAKVLTKIGLRWAPLAQPM